MTEMMIQENVKEAIAQLEKFSKKEGTAYLLIAAESKENERLEVSCSGCGSVSALTNAAIGLLAQNDGNPCQMLLQGIAENYGMELWQDDEQDESK